MPHFRVAPSVASVLLIVAGLGPTGCARYEYELRRPPEAAGVVAGHEAFARVDLDPLTYLFRAKEGRLVVRVVNPTGESIRLLGDRSAVVDPDGQSHPLPSQTIAPDSYGRLILPPPAPQLRGYGPTFGVGIGTSLGDGRLGRHRGPFGYGGYSGGPRYYAVIDEGNNYYWDWDGETVARLSLAFERDGGEPFAHEFVIARRKEGSASRADPSPEY